MDDFIARYPIHTQITVAWGEMDALKHVNNVVYFRYFETARIDYLIQTELMSLLQSGNIGPVISENQARYKRPVTFPDTLTIGTHISDIQADRFMMHYTAFSQAQQAVTTTGSAQVVMFDFSTGKKAELPDAVIAVLQQHCRDSADA
ncbi:thioesterase family protein [Shewanella sp. NIFS-20-20]|uniref:acyl-CoA thioesterase n=1 Tax=Shewanella sp. NIFS-20-20 TaxID=2853806 RepID=UPI001C495882|nr:thioesterase family protein [Shewanella sp. NIFS-20-20]MBV7317228.1 acyl-CoA thioesterase [Shewanella sp. NIFS-20-20]